MMKKLLLPLLCLGLASCATGPGDPPADAPNMKEVYQAGMAHQTDYVVHQGKRNTNAKDEESYELVKPIKVDVPSLAGALQSPQLLKRQSDINNDFPMLPNPQVMVYIYPHFKDDLPIYGNWTTFSMYAKNVYALPSEVNTGYNIKTY